MKRQGNALLISILLTSILVLITVGLSRLISNETLQLAELIRNGKANYLAESGSEIGLYLVHSNKAGTEPTNNGEQLKISNEDGQTFSYQIEAQTNQVPINLPYVYEEIQKGNLKKEVLFSNLELGESVQIAILENPTGGSQRFAVEYYLPTEANINSLADWDILLWKLFGTNENGDTESMSEYFPASYATASGGIAPSQIRVGKSADYPARFGSLSYSTEVTQNGFNCGNFFPFSTGEEDQSNILTLDSAPTEESRCNDSIAEFLDTHSNVYLVLTNAINTTQIQAADVNKELIANIKYRVCTPDCRLPGYEGLAPVFTQIVASGTFGQNSKQLTTTVNPEGFLPVFDFSIYRTAE